MLATDEKKLRWLGIDLRARWRRRVAVVVTYLGFFVLIAEGAGECRSAHPVLIFFAVAALTLILLQWISIFRTGGLVKSFDDPPKSGYGKYRMVGSLDQWARYRYGVASFDEAGAERQTELLRRYRVGNYLVPAKLMEYPTLDERGRADRDRISCWALGQVALYLACFAGMTPVEKHPLPPIEAAATFWTFCVPARTLSQARVLWTEPDPREIGDLRLAEGAA